VRVHESGTRVGGHRTHVKALDMRTVGLGGDSIIHLTKGHLEIGPRRVGPVCWLASKDAGVKAALQYLENHLDDYRDLTEPMQFFILTDHNHAHHLSDDEQAIVAVLSRRPYSIDELTSKLGLAWHTMLRTERHEEHHIITRCGLTPTDILHVSGEFVRWDTASAQRMCDLYAKLWGIDTKTLIERVREAIVRKLTVEILKKKLDETTNSDELDTCGVCKTLLDNLFNSNGDGYKVSITLDCPVIGVGAPAGYFVPAAAKNLGTEAIIPQHADVANAIGAISSDVLIRRTVRISVDAEAFVTEGLPGARRFSKLEDAHDYAVEEIAKLVRQTAHESGTSTTDVKISYSDIIGPAADGMKVYLGREIRAELCGRPDIKISHRP
jgi:N-methylhydantoinase A/oxoprolinase/acetone carboxylase beta subunit